MVTFFLICFAVGAVWGTLNGNILCGGIVGVLAGGVVYYLAMVFIAFVAMAAAIF